MHHESFLGAILISKTYFPLKIPMSKISFIPVDRKAIYRNTLPVRGRMTKGRYQ